ncbi:MAG: DNA gyrase subunit A, partial [Muribaculaceae bacterium]|nr:DNA gyrase subunit A [Muribaculaceae bacterium]
IIIREDDQLIQVRLTNGNSEIIIANKEGRAIRFHESKVREMGRMSTGVKGMTLGESDDEVIGMITMNGDQDETVLVVSQNGYGKRSPLEDYRVTNRGGKGVKTMNITDKTGNLVAIKNVNDSNDLMIINQSGITLRLPVEGIRVMGRATQGVKLIDLAKRGDTIASVCKVDSDPEEQVNEELAEDAAEISENALVEEVKTQVKQQSLFELDLEENEISDDPSELIEE